MSPLCIAMGETHAFFPHSGKDMYVCWKCGALHDAASGHITPCAPGWATRLKYATSFNNAMLALNQPERHSDGYMRGTERAYAEGGL